MKEKLLLGFIVFFAFVNFAIAQQADLSLNATFDKDEYQVGQPVVLVFTIKNTSAEELLVRWDAADIIVKSGGESIFKRKGIAGKRGEVKKLKPGESWENRLEFTSESFDMPPAGTYEAVIIYKNKQKKGTGKMYGSMKTSVRHDLWTGAVKTTATLNIK